MCAQSLFHNVISSPNRLFTTCGSSFVLNPFVFVGTERLNPGNLGQS